MTKTIRVGSGLGDAMYLQAVVRHMLSKGYKLKVSTKWPDVFSMLDVETVPFTKSRKEIDIFAGYSLRKSEPTDQFEDCCIQAGIEEPVEFKMDWSVKNTELIEKVKQEANGKPIILVQMPRPPMDRKDGFGETLLPRQEAFQEAVDEARGKAFLVQIGAGEPTYELEGIDLDLSNSTSIHDLFDLGLSCDGLLGYCSFIVPLAEQFDKDVLFIWARAGLKDRHKFIRQITPKKILHAETSKWVFDDDSRENIRSAVLSLLRQG